MWVGGSVAAVKPPQAVLPAKKITLTLPPASSRSIFRLFFFLFFWGTPLSSYGAIGQKERWTPMASCGGDRVNNSILLKITESTKILSRKPSINCDNTSYSLLLC